MCCCSPGSRLDLVASRSSLGGAFDTPSLDAQNSHSDGYSDDGIVTASLLARSCPDSSVHDVGGGSAAFPVLLCCSEQGTCAARRVRNACTLLSLMQDWVPSQ
jgi:hypothetical protein